MHRNVSGLPVQIGAITAGREGPFACHVWHESNSILPSAIIKSVDIDSSVSDPENGRNVTSRNGFPASGPFREASNIDHRSTVSVACATTDKLNVSKKIKVRKVELHRYLPLSKAAARGSQYASRKHTSAPKLEPQPGPPDAIRHQDA